MRTFLDAVAAVLRRNPWISVVFALFLAKVLLLLAARGELVQEHWRVPRENASVLKDMLFVALLGISILIPTWLRPRMEPKIGRKIMPIFFILAIAVLIPETLSRNYIRMASETPVSAWELRHYIMLDIFFRPPYLALHFLAIAVAWWASVRKNDDRIALSVFAISMSIVCGTYLARESHALMWADIILLTLVSTVGIIQIVVGRNLSDRRWAPVFFLLAAVVGCSLFGYHKHFSQSLSFFFAYCILATVFAGWLDSNLFNGSRRSGFLWLFWAYAFFLAINFGYPLAKNYGSVLRVGILSAKYISEDVIIVLLFFLILRHLKRWGMPLFLLFSLVYVVVVYIDLNYYLAAGRRISSFMLEMGGGTGLAVRMVSDYLTPLFFLGLALLAGVAISGPLYALISKERASANARAPLKWIAVAILCSVAGFLSCEQDPHAASLPRKTLTKSHLFRNIQSKMVPEDKLVEGLDSVGIPLLFDQSAPGEVKADDERPNLVLVVLESMYNKQLSLFNGEDETQPLMRQHTNRMVRFPNIFCNWCSSNHARTTIWTGLYPVRPYLTKINPAIARSSLTEILHDAGYFNAIFYSSHKNYTRLNDYLQYRDIDLFEDANSLGEGIADEMRVNWGVREEITLDAIKNFLDSRANKDSPFSLTYIPACPHMPYDTFEERFKKFDDGFGLLDGNYTGVYKNQLLYMDHILNSLMEYLEKLGMLEETLVVMINDHGENLNAQEEGLGHGWSTYPEFANIAMLLLPPNLEEGQINHSIGSQVDVLPTVLDYLDIESPAKMPMQGRSLKGKLINDRRIYLGSYKDFSVIEGENFYWYPDGGMSDKTCYSISNKAARTFFNQTAAPKEEWEALAEDYAEFQRLQESLLRYYKEYKMFDNTAQKR